MATILTFDGHWLNRLLKNPEAEIGDSLPGNPYTARIAIPYYKQKVELHYKDIIGQSLEQESQLAEIPFNFEHFGVIIEFAHPLEVQLYDTELNITRGLCEIIARTGPIILRNVYFESSIRSYGHRNRFPHLQFHIDRSANQPTRYSMYSRDPFDAEQKAPRTASTLFVPNLISYLQGIKEGDVQRNIDKGVRTTCNLFNSEDMSTILNNIALEQTWNQPEGTGEIAMIDNATVLHASYYRNSEMKAYRIGVRYLAGL